MKISNVSLYPFAKNDLDKMTYQKSLNRRFLETGSDVIKTKKSIINFYYEVSDVKISWKSVEAYSRNPLYKNGKKKKNNNNNMEKET